MATITVTSFVEPLQSHLQCVKRRIEGTVTFTHPVTSNVQKQAVAIAKSMIDDIVSGVETMESRAENANSKTYKVVSHVGEIGSGVSRKVRATKTVESHLQQFNIVTDIIIPNDIEKPIYASVYIMQNQSTVQELHNKTNIGFKENATEMSVI